MNYSKKASLDITLREFLSVILSEEEADEAKDHTLSLDFFRKLSAIGYSYYELLSIYASIGTFSVDDLIVLASGLPTPAMHLTVNEKNIRQCISRWMASRYHTAPINQVVKQIEYLLLSGDPGISTFNSNLNLKNQRAVNDRYVLLILPQEKYLIDINRRLIYDFITS